MEKDNRDIKEKEASNNRNQAEHDPKNPFRDYKKVSTQPSKEEEARLEQERKEALTERD